MSSMTQGFVSPIKSIQTATVLMSTNVSGITNVTISAVVVANTVLENPTASMTTHTTNALLAATLTTPTNLALQADTSGGALACNASVTVVEYKL